MGDVFVEIGATERLDRGRATELFAGQLGITKTDLDKIITEKQLVWHHDIQFAKDGALTKVRMVLVPKYINNSGKGGFQHMGGRAIIDFHEKYGIPLGGAP
jgi:hypothetical protein